MRILFTSACKPIPIFLNRFLSVDDVSYRFIVDQGPFSATADIPCFSLHFLAQNVATPSTVLEWPTFEELEAELKSQHYDYLAIGFKVIDLNHVGGMIPFIRKVSPDTKIVLGGYGTLALNEPQFVHIRDSVDYVCDKGDGIKFMRALLQEPMNRGVQAHLPVETIRIPWLDAVSSFPMDTQIGYLLSALGCVWKCEFCCTSAYTQGQTIDVMTAPEIVDSMKYYFRNYPRMKHTFIMDEELLLRKHKVEQIGKLIREDEELGGLSTLCYLAFGTVKAISRWEPEQLLLNGVGEVWTGIESKFSYQKKKGEADQKSLIEGLNNVGIEPQLSWIMGDDCQTKENIQEDVDYLISFNPVTVQLTVLAAMPGTALYNRLKKASRIGAEVVPEEYHLFGDTMSSLHFKHDERVEVVLDTYRRLYEALGPSSMRSIGVWMNGYEYCARSSNPQLNVNKKSFFKKKIEYSIFLIKTAIEMAPSPQAKACMEDLYKRYCGIFGPMRKSQMFMADRALSMAQKEMDRRAREGYTTLRDVPLKRYVYEGTQMPLVEAVAAAAVKAPAPVVLTGDRLPVLQ